MVGGFLGLLARGFGAMRVVCVGGRLRVVVQALGVVDELDIRRHIVAAFGDAGIRLFFDPIEIMAFGRFEQFTSKFKGNTSLANSQTQYPDVTLTDRYYGGFGTVGVAF